MSMPPTLRLIIHGKRTTNVLRDLCILYEVCLLKVCHFYFLFFREDISVTSKGVGHVFEQHLGFADGYTFFGCLSFFPIMFLLPKDSL